VRDKILEPAFVNSMTRVAFAEKLLPAEIQPSIDATAKYAGFEAFASLELIAPSMRTP
jgi:hypothetical protein